MAAKSKPAGKKDKSAPWMLYLLRCTDLSLYTGITNNLARRFQMHQNGKASRYTRTRRPVELCYSEICGSRAQALVRECAVKAYSREKKEKLILAPQHRPASPATARTPSF
ncbi:MAG: hypothetical protein A2Z83_03880 [Omnitrophica bacterium GWA2_52_8]|nr:MAG: hypothetical protein A2Z83_03880 [Omnitrophica bacterium GWA2_52_8]